MAQSEILTKADENTSKDILDIFEGPAPRKLDGSLISKADFQEALAKLPAAGETAESKKYKPDTIYSLKGGPTGPAANNAVKRLIAYRDKLEAAGKLDAGTKKRIQAIVDTLEDPATPRAAFAIYDEDGIAQGVMLLRPIKNRAGQEMIGVDSLYTLEKGTGVGSKLMSKAAQIAKRRETDLIVVGSVEDAKPFYAKMGAWFLKGPTPANLDPDDLDTLGKYGTGFFDDEHRDALADGTPLDARDDNANKWMQKPAEETKTEVADTTEEFGGELTQNEGESDADFETRVAAAVKELDRRITPIGLTMEKPKPIDPKDMPAAKKQLEALKAQHDKLNANWNYGLNLLRRGNEIRNQAKAENLPQQHKDFLNAHAEEIVRAARLLQNDIDVAKAKGNAPGPKPTRNYDDLLEDRKLPELDPNYKSPAEPKKVSRGPANITDFPEGTIVEARDISKPGLPAAERYIMGADGKWHVLKEDGTQGAAVNLSKKMENERFTRDFIELTEDTTETETTETVDGPAKWREFAETYKKLREALLNKVKDVPAIKKVLRALDADYAQQEDLLERRADVQHFLDNPPEDLTDDQRQEAEYLLENIDDALKDIEDSRAARQARGEAPATPNPSTDYSRLLTNQEEEIQIPKRPAAEKETGTELPDAGAAKPTKPTKPTKPAETTADGWTTDGNVQIWQDDKHKIIVGYNPKAKQISARIEDLKGNVLFDNPNYSKVSFKKDLADYLAQAKRWLLENRKRFNPDITATVAWNDPINGAIDNSVENGRPSFWKRFNDGTWRTNDGRAMQNINDILAKLDVPAGFEIFENSNAGMYGNSQNIEVLDGVHWTNTYLNFIDPGKYIAVSVKTSKNDDGTYTIQVRLDGKRAGGPNGKTSISENFIFTVEDEAAGIELGKKLGVYRRDQLEAAGFPGMVAADTEEEKAAKQKEQEEEKARRLEEEKQRKAEEKKRKAEEKKKKKQQEDSGETEEEQEDTTTTEDGDQEQEEETTTETPEDAATRWDIVDELYSRLSDFFGRMAPGEFWTDREEIVELMNKLEGEDLDAFMMFEAADYKDHLDSDTLTIRSILADMPEGPAKDKLQAFHDKMVERSAALKQWLEDINNARNKRKADGLGPNNTGELSVPLPEGNEVDDFMNTGIPPEGVEIPGYEAPKPKPEGGNNGADNGNGGGTPPPGGGDGGGTTPPDGEPTPDAEQPSTPGKEKPKKKRRRFTWERTPDPAVDATRYMSMFEAKRWLRRRGFETAYPYTDSFGKRRMHDGFIVKQLENGWIDISYNADSAGSYAEGRKIAEAKMAELRAYLNKTGGWEFRGPMYTRREVFEDGTPTPGGPTPPNAPNAPTGATGGPEGPSAGPTTPPRGPRFRDAEEETTADEEKPAEANQEPESTEESTASEEERMAQWRAVKAEIDGIYKDQGPDIDPKWQMVLNKLHAQEQELFDKLTPKQKNIIKSERVSELTKALQNSYSMQEKADREGMINVVDPAKLDRALNEIKDLLNQLPPEYRKKWEAEQAESINNEISALQGFIDNGPDPDLLFPLAKDKSDAVKQIEQLKGRAKKLGIDLGKPEEPAQPAADKQEQQKQQKQQAPSTEALVSELQKLINDSVFQPQQAKNMDELAAQLQALHERNARIAELKALLRDAGFDPETIKPNISSTSQKNNAGNGPSAGTVPNPDNRADKGRDLIDVKSTEDELDALEAEGLPRPDQEQRDIIDAILSAVSGNKIGRMIVQALAGSGKTATLVAAAKILSKRFGPDKNGLYLVFNRITKLEADDRMPGNIVSRTGDALAVAWIRAQGERRFKKGERNNAALAEHFGIKDLSNDIKAPLVARKLLNVIKMYSISADDEIGEQHFKDPRGNEILPFTPELLENAKAIWADLQDIEHFTYLDYHHAVKMWALSRPDLLEGIPGSKKNADFIFADEAQDLNPVMAKILKDQGIPVIFVGDGNQAIYGFRGAVNELGRVLADVILPMRNTYRMDENLAGFPNVVLSFLGSNHKMFGKGTTVGEVADSIDNPDVVITRTRNGLIDEMLRIHEEQKTSGGPAKILGIPLAQKSKLENILETYKWLKGLGPEPSNPHESLIGFSNWDEVVAAALLPDADDDLIKTVRLVDGDNPDFRGNEKLESKYSANILEEFLDAVIAYDAPPTKVQKTVPFSGTPGTKGTTDNNLAQFNIQVDGKGRLILAMAKSLWVNEKGLDPKEKERRKFLFAKFIDDNFKGRPGIFWSGMKDKDKGAPWNNDWDGTGKYYPAVSWIVPFDSQEELDKFLLGIPEFTDGTMQIEEEVPTPKADIIATTAHGFKGKEADRVQLAEDWDFFKPKSKQDENGVMRHTFPTKEEMRILYVALSRAKKALGLGGARWLRDWALESDKDPNVASRGIPDNAEWPADDELDDRAKREEAEEKKANDEKASSSTTTSDDNEEADTSSGDAEADADTSENETASDEETTKPSEEAKPEPEQGPFPGPKPGSPEPEPETKREKNFWREFFEGILRDGVTDESVDTIMGFINEGVGRYARPIIKSMLQRMASLAAKGMNSYYAVRHLRRNAAKQISDVVDDVKNALSNPMALSIQDWKDLYTKINATWIDLLNQVKAAFTGSEYVPPKNASEGPGGPSAPGDGGPDGGDTNGPDGGNGGGSTPPGDGGAPAGPVYENMRRVEPEVLAIEAPPVIFVRDENTGDVEAYDYEPGVGYINRRTGEVLEFNSAVDESVYGNVFEPGEEDAVVVEEAEARQGELPAAPVRPELEAAVDETQYEVEGWEKDQYSAELETELNEVIAASVDDIAVKYDFTAPLFKPGKQQADALTNAANTMKLVAAAVEKAYRNMRTYRYKNVEVILDRGYTPDAVKKVLAQVKELADNSPIERADGSPIRVWVYDTRNPMFSDGLTMGNGDILLPFMRETLNNPDHIPAADSPGRTGLMPAYVELADAGQWFKYPIVHEWGHSLITSRGGSHLYNDTIRKFYEYTLEHPEFLDTLNRYGKAKPTEGTAEVFAQWFLQTYGTATPVDLPEEVVNIILGIETKSSGTSQADMELPEGWETVDAELIDDRVSILKRHIEGSSNDEEQTLKETPDSDKDVTKKAYEVIRSSLQVAIQTLEDNKSNLNIFISPEIPDTEIGADRVELFLDSRIDAATASSIFELITSLGKKFYQTKKAGGFRSVTVVDGLSPAHQIFNPKTSELEDVPEGAVQSFVDISQNLFLFLPGISTNPAAVRLSNNGTKSKSFNDLNSEGKGFLHEIATDWIKNSQYIDKRAGFIVPQITPFIGEMYLPFAGQIGQTMSNADAFAQMAADMLFSGGSPEWFKLFSPKSIELFSQGDNDIYTDEAKNWWKQPTALERAQNEATSMRRLNPLGKRPDFIDFTKFAPEVEWKTATPAEFRQLATKITKTIVHREYTRALDPNATPNEITTSSLSPRWVQAVVDQIDSITDNMLKTSLLYKSPKGNVVMFPKGTAQVNIDQNLRILGFLEQTIDVEGQVITFLNRSNQATLAYHRTGGLIEAYRTLHMFDTAFTTGSVNEFHSPSASALPLAVSSIMHEWIHAKDSAMPGAFSTYIPAGRKNQKVVLPQSNKLRKLLKANPGWATKYVPSTYGEKNYNEFLAELGQQVVAEDLFGAEVVERPQELTDLIREMYTPEALAIALENERKRNIAKTVGLQAPEGFKTIEFTNSNGEAISTGIVDIGRKVAIKNINGVDIPFFLSTGTSNTGATTGGKWYPFFGIAESGWFNKGASEEDLTTYYGVEALREAAQQLDAEIGDVRDDANIPNVKGTPDQDQVRAIINADLDPRLLPRGESDITEYKKYKQSVIDRINGTSAPVDPNDQLNMMRLENEEGAKKEIWDPIADQAKQFFKAPAKIYEGQLAKAHAAKTIADGLLERGITAEALLKYTWVDRHLKQSYDITAEQALTPQGDSVDANNTVILKMDTDGEFSSERTSDFLVKNNADLGNDMSAVPVEFINEVIEEAKKNSIEQIALIGTPEATQLLATLAASGILTDWADAGTGSGEAIQHSLQAPVVQMFPETLDQQVAIDFAASSMRTQELDPIEVAAAETIYDNTQQFFKDRGITEVTVYRGVGGLPGDIYQQLLDSDGVLDNADIVSFPISSWTTDQSTAWDFAQNSSDSGVLRQTIPVSQVFATPLHGLGAFGEQELVVLGGKNTVDIQETDAFDAEAWPDTDIPVNPNDQLNMMQLDNSNEGNATHYVSRDGTYGDARGIALVDASKFTDEDWETLELRDPKDRPDMAKLLAEMHSSTGAPTHYVATDGGYGDARGIALVDASKFTEDDWETLESGNPDSAPDTALLLEKMHSGLSNPPVDPNDLLNISGIQSDDSGEPYVMDSKSFMNLIPDDADDDSVIYEMPEYEMLQRTLDENLKGKKFGDLTIGDITIEPHNQLNNRFDYRELGVSYSFNVLDDAGKVVGSVTEEIFMPDEEDDGQLLESFSVGLEPEAKNTGFTTAWRGAADILHYNLGVRYSVIEAVNDGVWFWPTRGYDFQINNGFAWLIDAVEAELDKAEKDSRFKDVEVLKNTLSRLEELEELDGEDPGEKLPITPLDIVSIVSEDGSALGRRIMIAGDSWHGVKDLSNSELSTGTDISVPAEPDTSYQRGHTAPRRSKDTPSIDNITDILPADVLDPAVQERRYGSGNPADKESFKIINSVQGNPDAEVTIYRAVPNRGGPKQINPGDWVTGSRLYAEQHLEGVSDTDAFREEGGTILSKVVKASELFTDANSVNEWGYDPLPENAAAPVNELSAIGVPDAPGTQPIPEGMVRLFHYTTPEAVESIKANGLAPNEEGGSFKDSEPALIWASQDEPAGGEDQFDLKPVVEFYVSKEKWESGDGGIAGNALGRPVAAENIIAVHEPWHRWARNLAEIRTPEEIADGALDQYKGINDPVDRAVSELEKLYKPEDTETESTAINTFQDGIDRIYAEASFQVMSDESPNPRSDRAFVKATVADNIRDIMQQKGITWTQARELFLGMVDTDLMSLSNGGLDMPEEWTETARVVRESPQTIDLDTADLVDLDVVVMDGGTPVTYSAEEYLAKIRSELGVEVENSVEGLQRGLEEAADAFNEGVSDSGSYDSGIIPDYRAGIIGTPEADEVLYSAVASGILAAWSYTSIDGTVSPAIQKIAAEKFNIANPIEDSNEGSSYKEGYNTFLEKYREALTAAVEAMYEQTQAFLKKQGITSIRAYRGMQINVEDNGTAPLLDEALKTPDDFTFTPYPLSSWSFNKNTAEIFARSDLSEYRRGMLIYADIPALDIFSIPYFGIGALDEYEIVVTGDPRSVTASEVFPR